MNVAATVRADVSLQVGSASESVTVSANALAGADRYQRSQFADHRRAGPATRNKWPQRDVAGHCWAPALPIRCPPSTVSPPRAAAQRSISTACRYDHNNWLIDGGEVYDRGSGGKLDVAVSPDALAEFQTLASNYTPDYGINSGGTVLMVLKSGTQKFHGALWEFNRNDAFDAGYYFFKQAEHAHSRASSEYFWRKYWRPDYQEQDLLFRERRVAQA